MHSVELAASECLRRDLSISGLKILMFALLSDARGRDLEERFHRDATAILLIRGVAAEHRVAKNYLGQGRHP